ncbi:hypothetical protein ACIBF5_23945 [Micromonospora sp. NPDC050417]|uniref:hypothetical protein n=1 Tax=Micromonospora sp. NPDC050417 TaxID=3364280 RepID=UPI0037A2FF2D
MRGRIGRPGDFPRTRDPRITCPWISTGTGVTVGAEPQGNTAQSQSLLVYTATPGSESYEKLRLLSVVASQGI